MQIDDAFSYITKTTRILKSLDYTNDAMEIRIERWNLEKGIFFLHFI